MSNTNETILEVDLNKLKHNYYYLKSLLKNDCKIIAVVKAFAYGHGDVVISKTLEKLGVDTFWVADFEEGISLREGGVKSKIIVANPGRKSFNEIIKNDLDVVLHNKNLLDFYISKNTNVNVHIKFNTGMNRYGFNLEEIGLLVSKLKEFPHLKIASICSHLAAADDKSKDPFTQKQFEKFNTICKLFSEKLNINPNRHILNTAGVLRFPRQQKEMVRLGIGLYGIGKDVNLKVVGKLVSNVAQIRTLRKGEGVGYDALDMEDEAVAVEHGGLGEATV